MYTVSKIAEITGGKVFSKSGDAEVHELLIDSRRLIRPEGTLFVALVTARTTDINIFPNYMEKV